MEKQSETKSSYWAIFQGKEILFEGSFTECWKELVKRFASRTVASLVSGDIRIARKS